MIRVKEYYRMKFIKFEQIRIREEANIKADIFTDEKEKKKGILAYIKHWLSSPFFVLHFCRFGVMFWSWFLPSYACVLLLLW